VKALVCIPIVSTVDEFKEYYFGIAAEMDQYNGFDRTGQNAVLPLFQSFDPDLLQRTDYTTWTTTGTNPKALPPPVTTPVFRVEHSDRYRDIVVKITTTTIKKVVNQDGHPTVRTAGIVLGGYVGGGYIDHNEAESLLFSLIEHNEYLRKDITNYKRTARWAISQGQARPLILNCERYG
jgi:hypothetical protein